MRLCVMILSLLGVLSLGCDQQAQPKAHRGIPANMGNSAKPADRSGDWNANDVAAGRSEAADHGSGPEVLLESITLTAPSDWKRQPPRSSFVLAEFMLPRAGKDVADGRLTVTTAGGTIEENIERWKGQFADPLKSAKKEQLDAGLQVTLVDFAGTYNEQADMFAAPVARPGYRMIAAIIPVNDQSHFVKAVGPQDTMAAWADAIKTFVRSWKKRVYE